MKGWTGAIVTNPNCSDDRAGDGARAAAARSACARVIVTTMQAVSGAGYPGVPSLDILGNVMPFIGGGEEEKIETRDAEDPRQPTAAARRTRRSSARTPIACR